MIERMRSQYDWPVESKQALERAEVNKHSNAVIYITSKGLYHEFFSFIELLWD